MTHKNYFFIIGTDRELKLESVEEVIALMSSDAREQVCNIEYGFETIYGHRVAVDVGAVHDNRAKEVTFVFSEGTREAAEPERAMALIREELENGWDELIKDTFDIEELEELTMQLSRSDVCVGYINWNKF